MTFDERLKAICSGMAARNLDLIVAVHDGGHFIETPNPVTVLTGFKSLGPVACLLGRGGDMRLVMTPAWDAARAREACPDATLFASSNLADALDLALPRGARAIGTVGLSAAASGIAAIVADRVPNAVEADDVVYDAAASKTDDETAWAREATRIAELNFERLLAIARPGMSEDE